MSKVYDYYVEPCQLCISRNGSTYNSCGWCHDSDTHFKKTDGTYPGDWISIPYQGDGYPFHEMPHPTRKYYKSGKYIELSDGKLPSDVSINDIEEAYVRNSAMKELYGRFSSGNVTSLFQGKSQVKEKRSLSLIDHFASRYHSISTEEIQIENDGGLPIGKFDQYTLGVSFSGLSDQFIEAGKAAIIRIEKEMRGEPNTIVEMVEMVEKFPELKNLLIGCELVSHEYFHLFQTITTSAGCKLYVASRKITYLRFMAFVVYVKNGGKYDLDNEGKISVLQYLESMPFCDEKDQLFRLFHAYRKNIDLIDNFFNYKEAKSIQVIDLFEGAAYAFQKLFNRSGGIETFQFSSDSRYGKALYHFEQSGGHDSVVYLIFCHISLQYGMIDNGDFMEVIPTPQDIFIHLCASELCCKPHYIRRIFGATSFKKRPKAAFLKKRGIELSQAQEDFINSLSAENHHLAALTDIIEIFDSAIDLVKDYFELRKVNFSDASFPASDERFIAVKGALATEHPLIDDPIFFLSMLVVPSFGYKFVFNDIETSLQVPYKGLMGNELTAQQEDAIYSVMNDIDSLLRGPTAYCCNEHPCVGYSTIRSCENEFSLSARAETILGISIKSIFE